ncbi:hypothetical protein [Tropicimonas sediminicola]|uniref:Uncharacterized protein n=1 Tax=Tropicimonas sediminicola TaxID=1031541 RepID=A0A239F7G2_9RHOB|nr:hypothetical protein [Tropicimonas sediminicola]SNS52418.1 hypothetical protein SAMN05421757_102520 [Tropicimonas sediminicola]
MIRPALACLAALLATPLAAEDFTTAAEVRPILNMQRASWIAVREYDGQDLVYFTSVLAWRCGLESVHYGFNDAPAETPLEMEPCHTDTATPNAITGDAHPIYVTAPLGSVETIRLRLTYDDGMTDEASYARKDVLMP